MIINGQKENNNNDSIQIKEEKIEKVNEFTYLGSNVSNDGKLQNEITIRVTKAMNAFRKLYETLWKIPHISSDIKMRIYRTSIIPILTYGSETWTPLKNDLDRLETCQMRCLRSILRISLKEHITNNEIRNRTSQMKIEEIIRINRLRWLGHVKRMKKERLPIHLLYGRLTGKRPSHKAYKRWTDIIKDDIKKRNIHLLEWWKITEDREEWRKIVKGEKINSRQLRNNIKMREKKSMNEEQNILSSEYKDLYVGKEREKEKEKEHENEENKKNKNKINDSITEIMIWKCPNCSKTCYSSFGLKRHTYHCKIQTNSGTRCLST